METVIILFTIASGWIAFLVHKGNKVVKRQQALIEALAAEDGTAIEQLSTVSYHGGFPEIPVPQKLNLSCSDDYVVLATHGGEYGKLRFDSCKAIEKFSTMQRHDPKQRSMVLFGPFNNLLFKDRERHFIVIHYRDSEGQENRCLLEHGKPGERDEIFTRLDSSLRKRRMRAEA